MKLVKPAVGGVNRVFAARFLRRVVGRLSRRVVHPRRFVNVVLGRTDSATKGNKNKD